jgi:hypothetical protein
MTGEPMDTEIIQEAIDQLKRREFKTLVKEAIKEWLDEQSVKVGRWSARFIGLSVLGALAYFVLTTQGWHK